MEKILNLGSKVLYKGCKSTVIAAYKTPDGKQVLRYVLDVATGKGFKTVYALPTEFTVVKRAI